MTRPLALRTLFAKRKTRLIRRVELGNMAVRGVGGRSLRTMAVDAI
jgi:hypothetical protein